MRALILRIALALAATTSFGLTAAGGAQAIVVNDAGDVAGVALIPGTPLPPGVSTLSSGSSCQDPWLTSDFALPSDGLCYRGGAVMRGNETFDITWDQHRLDWATTRDYLETFLGAVAADSGPINPPYRAASLGSPFAVTSQYHDSGGRAADASVYGGGCIDYGSVGGSACKFGKTSGSGNGHDYGPNGCPVTGYNEFYETLSGFYTTASNQYCLTDAQIQSEVAAMVSQEGLIGRTQAGYTPLVVVNTPPGVVVCLDSSGTLCSANGNPVPAPGAPGVSTSDTGGAIGPGTYPVEISYVTADGESVPSVASQITTTGSSSTIAIASPDVENGAVGWYAYVSTDGGLSFVQQGGKQAIGTTLTLTSLSDSGPPPSPGLGYLCSYHSQVSVGGTSVAYVVLPWVAQWTFATGCVDPSAPAIANSPSADELAQDVGAQLVSPLSQAEIAAIVNPGVTNGWIANDGTEIDDHGCIPFPAGGDNATIDGNQYALQREFNNGGVLESDPNAPACAPLVNLGPKFVAPSAVHSGDEVQFDGSASVSTLVVPKQGYFWNFGDGKFAIGPSVVHSYAKGGRYDVTLAITDRGGNVAELTQVITVTGPGGSIGSNTGTALKAALSLMPESLHSVLNAGISMHVTVNEAAAGFVSISIPRSEAREAHIAGRGSSVVIGRGTVSQLKDGTASLRLHISRSMAAKLKHLRQVTLTVRLQLVGTAGDHVAIDVAGRY